MFNRSLILASIVLAPTLAAASPDYGLELSAGAGAGTMYRDPCGGPFAPTTPCTTPEARLRGPAALASAMYGARYHLRRGWGLHWSAGGQATVMTDSGATGSILTGAGGFGMSWDRFSATAIAGLSYLRVRADGMTTTGGSLAFGGIVGVDITPQIGAYARLDLSAFLYGYFGGARASPGVSFRL